jgi:hypothetical protein
MKKWPHKHNSLGHWLWKGQIYGPGRTRALSLHRTKVFHGTWGSAPFQSLYTPNPGTLLSLSLMPEWYILALILSGLSALGFFWRPLLLFLPFLFMALLIPFIQAVQSSKQATFSGRNNSNFDQLIFRAVTTFLHLSQPLARLWGRMDTNLTTRQPKTKGQFALPMIRISNFWSEKWQAPEKRLETVEEALRSQCVAVLRGGEFDAWDLEIRGGLLSSVRTCMAVVDLDSGRQLIRFRSWPRIDPLSLMLFTLFSFLAIMAGFGMAWTAAGILGAVALILILRMFWNCSTAMASLLKAIELSGTEVIS